MISRLPFLMKLLAVFVLVVLVTAVLLNLMADRAIDAAFREFIREDALAGLERTVPLWADYYHRQGNSWDGVQNIFAPLALVLQRGEDFFIVLVDDQDLVVGSADPEAVGAAVSKGTTVREIPIESGSARARRIAGKIIVGTPQGVLGATNLGAVAQRFSEAENRAIWVAAMIAVLISLLFSVALARQISRPLRELAHAARRLAGGHLSERVDVQARDEFGQLARSFNEMAASLQRSEQARRQMIADIAHELRTPLATIQGNLEALQDGVYPFTAERLEALHTKVLLLNRLIADLQKLSLAEAGELSLDREVTDLAPLLSSLQEQIQPQFAAQGVTLDLHVSGPLGVEIDRQRIEEVLLNLLSNALRYTERGGRVTLSAMPHGKEVHVSVADTGPGISEADLPRVFDRFYRGDRSRSRASGGVGLGLAISKRLVELHGGKIWAESAIGQGATFTFSLPASQLRQITDI